MKQILFLLLFVISINSFSQDTTRVTLSTKARNVQALVKFLKNNDDTASVNLYNRWIQKFSVAVPPSGTQQVSTDSIAVPVVAFLYYHAMSFPQGSLSVGSDFASDIAAIRGSNNYLDRLLDNLDTMFAGIVAEARTKGREILTGKKQ